MAPDGPDLTTFRAKLDARKAIAEAAERDRLATQAAEGSVVDSSDPMAQFVPTDEQVRSDEDAEMDRIMDVITIRVAYEKWCGKSRIDARPGQTDSIKVSCPWPEHKDDHASASLNVDKQVFMCHGTCDKGGDKYDIAAIRFGFDLHTYKQGENFHKLRRAMAESIGYQFSRVPGQKQYAVEEPAQLDEQPDLEDAQEPVAEDPATVTAPLATVTTVFSDDEEDDDDYFYRQSILVDYAKFIKPGTFLDTWMNCTRIDDAPEDYHFWHGMIALGMAVGRDVWLVDSKGPVHSNLNVVLLGPSGVGKSRSKRYLDELWKGTNSYFDPKQEPPRGVKQMAGAGSGEVLIKQFEHAWSPDPTNPKHIELSPVRGLIEFSEFSQIVNVNSRRGSTLENAIMDIYDCKPLVSSMSLTTGEKKAKDPFGSLLTTTQPKMLKRLINQAALDSGFANRFIFATGLPKQTIEFGSVQADVTPSFSPYMAVQIWSRTNSDDGIGIKLTDEAKIFGNEFWEKNIKPIERGDSNALLKRIGLTMKKMLLLTAINERCEGITSEMMERTFSILPYLVRSTGVSGENLGESKDTEIVRAILEAAARTEKDNPGKGVTLREIRRMYQTKKYEIADVNKALENLVKIGELEKMESQRGPGRPTVRYRVAQ